MKKSLALFLTSSIIAPSLFFGASYATSTAPPTGLTVSPAIEQINLTKGQSNASFMAQITNNTKGSVDVSISTKDFTQLNQSGGVLFYNGSAPSGNLHGLAQDIKVGENNILLAPGASQIIPVTITTEGLSSGGHYGALVYQAASSSTPKKTNQVNVLQKISTLVFVTTSGEGTQSIQLNPVQWPSTTFNIPKTINLVFTNSGNTQITPRGVVTVTDSSDKEVAKGIVNIDSGLILPSTSRLYSVELRSEISLPKPGIYHLRMDYSFDGSNGAQTYTKKFLLISTSLIVGIIVVIIVLVVLIITLRKRAKKPRKPSKSKIDTAKKISKKIDISFE